MKKLLLGLGTLATIVAPIAAVVSCSTGTHHTEKKDNSNKTPTNEFKEISTIDNAKDQKSRFIDLGNKLKLANSGNLLSGKDVSKIELDEADTLVRITFKDTPSPADEVEDDVDDSYPVVRITVQVGANPGIEKIELLSEDGHDVKDVTATEKSKFATDIVTNAISAVVPDGNQGGDGSQVGPETDFANDHGTPIAHQTFQIRKVTSGTIFSNSNVPIDDVTTDKITSPAVSGRWSPDEINNGDKIDEEVNGGVVDGDKTEVQKSFYAKNVTKVTKANPAYVFQSLEENNDDNCYGWFSKEVFLKKMEGHVRDNTNPDPITKEGPVITDHQNQIYMQAMADIRAAIGEPDDVIDHLVAISKAKKMVDDILAQTGYAMEQDEINQLAEDLIAEGGDYELSIDAILPGQLEISKDPNQTHGDDDFMVMIGGALDKDYTGADGFGTAIVNGDKTLTRLNPLNPAQKGNIGTQLDSTDPDLESRWKQTKKEVKDSSFVLYLQHNDKDDTVTVQLSKVVKFGDEYYELDVTKAAFTSMDKYNEEFALGEYIAEKGITFSGPGGDSEYPSLDPYRTFKLKDKNGNMQYYTFTDEREDFTTSVATKVEGDHFWDASAAWIDPANKPLFYDFKTIMSTLELKIIDPSKVLAGGTTRGIDKLTDITQEQFKSFSRGQILSLRAAALEYVTIMAEGKFPKQIETLTKNGLSALSKEDQKIFIDKFMEAFDSFSK